jgi:hypothetical protein
MTHDRKALLKWVTELCQEMDEFRMAIPSWDEGFRMMQLRTAAACLEMERVRKELADE